MWPPRKPAHMTQKAKLVSTRSCKPTRLPRRVVKIEPTYTPIATKVPNGLIEKAPDGKPPRRPLGMITSSGSSRYGIAGALNTAGLLPHSPAHALDSRLLRAFARFAQHDQ